MRGDSYQSIILNIENRDELVKLLNEDGCGCAEVVGQVWLSCERTDGVRTMPCFHKNMTIMSTRYKGALLVKDYEDFAYILVPSIMFHPYLSVTTDLETMRGMIAELSHAQFVG